MYNTGSYLALERIVGTSEGSAQRTKDRSAFSGHGETARRGDSHLGRSHDGDGLTHLRGYSHDGDIGVYLVLYLLA